MSIRFCEFCSTVHPHETTHCSECGTRLVQTASEEYFNDPNNPWPFVPVSYLYVKIQGKPRTLRFSGTHSVFHLWKEMHTAYENGALYFRINGEEMELVSAPVGKRPSGYQQLDPLSLMECNHSLFSLYSYRQGDPELEEDENRLHRTYHGTFEIQDCPARFRKDILGWLAVTEPRPSPDNQWNYFMT